jgi:N-acetylglucosamine malate deacetylase 1
MRKSALILAPHPDDESIIGLLPWRLQEECGFKVWVVPATLGSRVERQAGRKKEFQAACKVLGFHWRYLTGGNQVKELCRILESLRPSVVFMPHAKDGHPTHRAVHRLGLAAMDTARRDFHVVETEYWHPLERPNLMVAAGRKQLAQLRCALACHAGEIARNDYAARLPAWMSDNVRRGAELIGGAGAAAPDIVHATLYRARKRSGSAWGPEFRGGRIVKSAKDTGEIAALWK